MKRLLMVMMMFSIAACHTAGAPRVKCDGRLRPINPPVPITVPSEPQP